MTTLTAEALAVQTAANAPLEVANRQQDELLQQQRLSEVAAAVNTGVTQVNDVVDSGLARVDVGIVRVDAGIIRVDAGIVRLQSALQIVQKAEQDLVQASSEREKIQIRRALQQAKEDADREERNRIRNRKLAEAEDEADKASALRVKRIQDLQLQLDRDAEDTERRRLDRMKQAVEFHTLAGAGQVMLTH